ncbi:MAG: DNA-binding protein [Hyphomicrobiales bacterium]|nr:DNA-binding protein [Hyphomicrobiales bacterium]
MFELFVAVLLIALNGVFALSELAIVSARKSRLKVMAESGRPGARVALDLAEDPGRFLSTVQIGITLVGILAGVFSGAALAEMLGDYLKEQGVRPLIANPASYVVVIGIITYLSVVIGELVPKHLALGNAEGIACMMAPPMALLSRVAAPIVWLLDSSTRLIFFLLGQGSGSETPVTEEEIKSLVAEAATAGVIEIDERRMISAVLRLGDRPVRSVMTPRTDVAWLDLDDDEEELRLRLRGAVHSRMPVARGAVDNIVGVVQLRELIGPALSGEPLDLVGKLRQAPVLPDTLDALDALQMLRQAEVPMALVHDEYGHFDGIVTPADILDAIAGAFRTGEAEEEPAAVRREDGSWLIAGWMAADDMAEQLGIALPEKRDYETAAGLVIDRLQHLPVTGERVDAYGWRFEVVDLDGRRVDKLLATPTADGDDGDSG